MRRPRNARARLAKCSMTSTAACREQSTQTREDGALNQISMFLVSCGCISSARGLLSWGFKYVNLGTSNPRPIPDQPCALLSLRHSRCTRSSRRACARHGIGHHANIQNSAAGKQPVQGEGEFTAGRAYVRADCGTTIMIHVLAGLRRRAGGNQLSVNGRAWSRAGVFGARCADQKQGIFRWTTLQNPPRPPPAC